MRRRRNTWDAVVIGGGIAGLTAAWHAAERGLATALYEGAPGFGGQVATVNVLHGWPAIAETSGFGLASALADEIRRKGVEIIHHDVTAVELVDGVANVRTANGTQRSQRVIVASGGRLNSLGIAEEASWAGKGLSHCADCDGPLYKDSDVVVVGGGDSALQEALILARFCRSVSVVVRSAFRAKRAYIEKAKGTTNIVFVWDSQVDGIRGHSGVTGVTVRNVKSGALTDVACSGIFPFVGITPNTGYLPAEVARDGRGAVKVDANLRSSVAAISAVGAARSGYCGQLVNAAADGALAAATIAAELSR